MIAALHHYFERCLVIGWMTQIDPEQTSTNVGVQRTAKAQLLTVRWNEVLGSFARCGKCANDQKQNEWKQHGISV